MSQNLLLPLTAMIAIATAIAMLVSAMLLPMPDAPEFPITDGTEVVERFYAAVNEAIATGNSVALQRVVNPSFVDENPLPGVNPGRAGLEEYLVALHDADPGLRLEADVISASSDQVVARVQVWHEPTEFPLPASLDERREVWGAIEVLRVADGAVVGRWSYTDGLTLARSLAERQVTLPLPTPRVISLRNVTLAPGTRWDAPRVGGPQLFYVQVGVIDAQTILGSAGEDAQDASSDALASDGGQAAADQRLMLAAGSSWLASAGSHASATNVGSAEAQVLVVAFSEPRIPNGVLPEAGSLPIGGEVEVLAGDLANDWGTGAVTVTLEQIAFAPGAALNLWSTDGPILVAVEMGQLEAKVWGTAWVRRHRDGMSVASRTDVLTTENGMLLQPGGVVALRNAEQQPVLALVVTIQRVGPG